MVYAGRFRPIVLFSAPISGPATHALATRTHATGDLSDLGGAGYIAGTVKVDSSPDYPVRRRVTLLHERDGRVVRETWSDAVTGEYRFDGLNPALRYIVIGHDHTRAFNADILAGITPLLP